MNCWEFTKCGPDVYKNCPAYPDCGLTCWKKTGKKCGHGREMPSRMDKIEHCRGCEFYKRYAEKF